MVARATTSADATERGGDGDRGRGQRVSPSCARPTGVRPRRHRAQPRPHRGAHRFDDLVCVATTTAGTAPTVGQHDLTAQLVAVVDAVHHEAPRLDPGHSRHDRSRLARMEDHPLHLGGFSDATEHPGQARVTIGPGHPRRQVTGPEADERVVRTHQRDDDLPLPLTRSHRRPTVEVTHLDVDTGSRHEPATSGGLVADEPHLGRAVGHEHRRHALLQCRPQGVRQGLGGDECLAQLPALGREPQLVVAVDERLEIAGQTDVCRHAEIRDRVRLQVLVADTAGHDRRAGREAALLEHRPGRRQVVAEAVEDDVAGADPHSLEGRCPTPRVGTVELGLVERSRRLEDPHDARARCDHPAERRTLTLEGQDVVLGHDREPGDAGPAVAARAHQVVDRQPGVLHPGREGGHGGRRLAHGVGDSGSQPRGIRGDCRRERRRGIDRHGAFLHSQRLRRL